MADIKIYAVAENKELSRICYTIPVSLDKNSWLNEEGIYKQTVSAEGIKADDMPILFKSTLPNISKNDFEDYGADYGLISGGQCAEGQITFYAADTLNQNITVLLGMGNKGDGRLLLCGGGSGEKTEYSNVTITILDSAGVAEGGTVTATCNNKSWETTIRNGKAKLYTSEVGNYTIGAVATDGTKYTTMLTCPYFGMFSTDIYSGTLKVVCTEAGGVGKTCQVRSCDDNYEPTNNYDLTQTFDDKLMLPFPGLPAGKYLITVDGKYVFFKHVESIQNINSVNVELKQWLYRNGDQCVWNTGGWVKGLTTASVNNNCGNNYTGRAVSTVKMEFNINRISYICNGASTAVYTGSTQGRQYYVRGGVTCIAGFGTIKPIKVSNGQRTLHIVGNAKIIAAFRAGNPNDETTQINTATILQSGVADNLVTNITTDGYLMLGGALNAGVVSNQWGSPGDVSCNYDGDITEIWLE